MQAKSLGIPAKFSTRAIELLDLLLLSCTQRMAVSQTVVIACMLLQKKTSECATMQTLKFWN